MKKIKLLLISILFSFIVLMAVYLILSFVIWRFEPINTSASRLVFVMTVFLSYTYLSTIIYFKK